MNAKYKSSVVFVLAVMLAALITGCAGMDNYYTSSTEKVVLTPAEKLALEAQNDFKAGDHQSGADKYRQLLSSNICASESNPVKCVLSAKAWLGYILDKQGKTKEALPYYLDVANTKLDPDNTIVEELACEAGLYAGKILLNDSKHDEAFRYFDFANGLAASNVKACDGAGQRDDIIHGLAGSVKGQKNGKRVASILKPVYYNQPTSANLKDYYAVLKQAGDKSEMNNVDKFHKKIVPLIEEWEKINAPSAYADESAKIEYNSRRAKLYANALKGAKKLGLKGYDDYLIAQVRASREAAESVVASQRYEAEAAQSRAQQDAEDAAMMNMFMNILTAPRRH